MKWLIAFVVALLLPTIAFAACPTTSLTFKDAAGATQTLCFGGGAGAFIPQYQILDSAGTNALTVSAAGAAKVDGSAVTQPISAASLPLPSGAATLTGLTTINTTLGSPFQAGGALAANQSVNVAQINGVTPLMGNGVTGTGSHRATVASDNSAVALWGHGVVGAASPANAVQMAGAGSGTLAVPVVCDNYTPFSFSSTSAQKIVTKAASKKVYICAINIVVAAATNVALIEGTKVTNECDTSTAGMAGGTTAATGWNFAANGGLTLGHGVGVVAKTANTNFDVCLLASGANQTSGGISWTQQP